MNNKNKCFLCIGAPGSGKSTLAKQLAKDNDAVICSADDFHTWWGNGTYKWSASRQKYAHDFCKYLFLQAVSLGKNVIVDNTNTKLSDMRPYINISKENQYKLFFIEPQTPWRYNAEECFKKNTHNVPIETIQRMIQQINTLMQLEEFRELCLT